MLFPSEDHESPMSQMGQSRHFGPVRRMSAYPLIAAREQKFRDRSFGGDDGTLA